MYHACPVCRLCGRLTASSLFAWIPVAFPETEFEGEKYYLVGLLGVVGVVAYQIGAMLAYLEAVNDGCIHGSFLRRFLEVHETDEKRLFDQKLRLFAHHMLPSRRKRRAGTNVHQTIEELEGGWEAATGADSALQASVSHADSVPRRGGLDLGIEQGQNREYHRFRWWPTWENFKSHHLYEIGFLACSIQFLGATMLIAPGIVALPGIPESLADWELNVAYWVPDIVGSVAFVTASMMLMLETQTKWYRPNFGVLGWWVSLWAVMGSVGFLLCGALGAVVRKYHWADYHATLANSLGSASFLVASLLMWYEAVNKRSISELREVPGKM
ncbi:hypothetical protein CLAFUW4_01897 [Fulvia fulva]|uniref:Integral membrane protein n=1 Tax=Passalora fulva TaxID=5499 RepID=A0A9Q8P4H3_PASFU|nr:uncharacterized protein CLAFUR5_01891 [Fulvia fulva]KAK4635159.1 hypothetical protein CLAFUR4_01892 [Fulvia fulva]KAK4637329.1 hypothetical protein CLAFUR0_01894 [Fulvia fulva]UJO12973.1 hypothetical protein CLAFUR5_01891 [Fulvia fulva]WPV08354.1 hypothetical protein CLAFUW4_01897 [Fulvia fulva]WPV23949.1 hypothetical protein CLAFUW7_01896 [Fulvia fulva]